MPFSDPPGDSIRVPASATDDDPRVIITTDDPILVANGLDAGQAFYWGPDRAFILAVDDPDIIPNPDGRFQIAAVSSAGTLARVLTASHFSGAGTTTVRLGDLATTQGVEVQAIGSVDVAGQDVSLVGGTSVALNAPFVTVRNRVLCTLTNNVYVDAGPGTSTTSTTYVAMPGVPDLELIKEHSSAYTKMRVALSCQIRASAACTVRFAVNIGTIDGPGSDYSLGQMEFAAAGPGSHSIERDITGLGAGARVLGIRWRISSGPGPSITFGTAHSLSVTASEVPLH